MANWWVVNKDPESPEYKQMYAGGDDAFKARTGIDADTQVWLEVPEGVAIGNCKVQDDEGVLSLVDGAADKAGPKWDLLRLARTARLIACDWTQVDDSPVDKAAWATYRQALRDLPQNTIDPDAPSWPSEPS